MAGLTGRLMSVADVSPRAATSLTPGLQLGAVRCDGGASAGQKSGGVGAIAMRVARLRYFVAAR